MAGDRTTEFVTLARSLPLRRIDNTAAASQAQVHYKDAAYTELRAFHQTASGISNDIAATSHMLQELTQLVKSSNLLFVHDSNKVNTLVVRIKQNIENLKGRLDQANATIAYRKSHLSAQAGQEVSNLVGQLKQELGQAAAGFKKALQQRTDNMKGTSDQKAQVYGGAVDFVSLDNKPPVYGDTKLTVGGANFPMLDLKSGMSAGEPTGSLPRPHRVLGVGSGSLTSPELRIRRSEVATNDHSNFTSLTPLGMERMEQDQQMQLIPDQNYLRERADPMSTVESNIVGLGTIFNKLAVVMSEHAELVHRVEDNVDKANSILTMSMNVLTSTLTNLRTNRALAAKVFAILAAFIIIVTIGFA